MINFRGLLGCHSVHSTPRSPRMDVLSARGLLMAGAAATVGLFTFSGLFRCARSPPASTLSVPHAWRGKCHA